MKISTKGRYALRLMMDVASHDDAGYVSLKDVAARQNISMKYLANLKHRTGHTFKKMIESYEKSL